MKAAIEIFSGDQKMGAIGTTRVDEVMITTLVTVGVGDKMDDVARLFKEQDIHAAPVVDTTGKCVGIITSHDLVEFESVRKDVQQELNHGLAFDMAHYGSGTNLRLPGQHFDEAGFHMSKGLECAKVDDSLSLVARNMCAKHRHHVLVLDDNQCPIGILSSLDLLGFVIGEPVNRSYVRDQTN